MVAGGAGGTMPWMHSQIVLGYATNYTIANQNNFLLLQLEPPWAIKIDGLNTTADSRIEWLGKRIKKKWAAERKQGVKLSKTVKILQQSMNEAGEDKRQTQVVRLKINDSFINVKRKRAVVL